MSRRDQTPGPIRLPQLPPAPTQSVVQNIELTPEEFGDIVRDTAKSLRQTEELGKKVDALAAEVKALSTAKVQGHVLITVGRWIAGTLILICISGVSWVVSEQRSHDVRLTRNETQLANQAETLERHSNAPGHVTGSESQLRSDISAMRSSLEAMRENMSQLREDMSQLREQRPRR